MDMGANYKFSKYDMRFLIKLKVRDFKKQNIHNISEEEIKEYLFNMKWKSRDVVPMCDIIDDIMNVQVSDIFEYLSVKVVKEASHLSIQDFNEFISK
ncbi:MAG: post-transcriptional regulator [Coprobacillaceae bacterium]